MLYDDDYDVDGKKKKPAIVTRVLKWSVYLLILFIYIFFMVRIFFSCDPKEASLLLVDETAVAVCNEVGEDNFILYNLKSRDSFGGGDTFFISNVVYLESSEQLQLTVRYKKNRITPEIDLSYIYLFPMNLVTSVTDSESGETVSGVSHDDYYSHTFDTSKYFYARVNFSNVEIDYNKTKVELYINALSLDPEEIENEDPLLRFTLFDVNTAKTKGKISDFDTEKINSAG